MTTKPRALKRSELRPGMMFIPGGELQAGLPSHTIWMVLAVTATGTNGVPPDRDNSQYNDYVDVTYLILRRDALSSNIEIATFAGSVDGYDWRAADHFYTF